MDLQSIHYHMYIKSYVMFVLETFKWRKEFGVDKITYESLNQESQIIGFKSFWPEVKTNEFKAKIILAI